MRLGSQVRLGSARPQHQVILAGGLARPRVASAVYRRSQSEVPESVQALGELCWSLFLAAPPDRPAQPAPPPRRAEAEARPGPRLDPALEAALDAELAAELG